MLPRAKKLGALKLENVPHNANTVVHPHPAEVRACNLTGHTTPSRLNWQKLPCRLFLRQTLQFRAAPPRM